MASHREQADEGRRTEPERSVAKARSWVWFRTDPAGRSPALEEFERLPAEPRAGLATRMERYRDGTSRFKDVDSLGDGIYELRCRHLNNEYRLLFTLWGPRCVALTVFSKNQRATPQRDLDRAQTRAAAWREADAQSATPPASDPFPADELGPHVEQAKADDPAFRAAHEDSEQQHRIVDSLVGLRHSFGLSQSEVARRMGVRQPTVSGFETEGSDPRLSTLQRYARAVGARLRLGVEVPRTCDWVSSSTIAYHDGDATGTDAAEVHRGDVVRRWDPATSRRAVQPARWVVAS